MMIMLPKWFGTAVAALVLCWLPVAAHAEIDGHGPDAWQVDGVAPNDWLNARMGPGTNYPVIETFAYDERGLQQITCVPFYTFVHYQAMSETERNRLPQRWCLMLSADMTKAGWVAQRYLVEEGGVSSSARIAPGDKDDYLVTSAEDLVRALYEMHTMALSGVGPSPLDPDYVGLFFFPDVVAHMQANPLQADPLLNAQDFEGSMDEPYRDPQQPMLRGMITVLVDFTNFGQPQRAVVRLRSHSSSSGFPVRILRIEHDGWSFP